MIYLAQFADGPAGHEFRWGNLMETIQLGEVKAPYTITINDQNLQGEVTLVEPNGQPVAMLIPFQEYSAFRAWQKNQKPIVAATSADFNKERTAFEEMRPTLLHTYPDKVVAIYQGQVVEVGDDIGETASKVYSRFGYVPCYVERVTIKPKIYKVPHRKVVR